jgi:3-oxoacyl-[acyl-carrier-protein] synthase II
MTQVVITGAGACTPLGADLAESWRALLAGESGVRRLTEDWAGNLPVRIAATGKVSPDTLLDRVRARRLDRSTQFALVSALEAWQAAGRPVVDPDRLSVVVATGVGGAVTTLSQNRLLAARDARRVSPWTIPMLMPNAAAAEIGLELGARGIVQAPLSACAAGAEAVARGLDLLRADRADVVVCGGTEAAIDPLVLAGFAAMQALSRRNDDPTRASRPYDRDRDGLVFAEGAGMLVLERRSDAVARGATPLAVLAGAGVTADAHHIAAPDPVGAGAGRAMTLALRDAGLEPGDVVHLNAHATSTQAGDLAEAYAIRGALKAAADGVAVSATKSQTGHLLGAAGAVEAAFTALAVRHRTAPRVCNLDDLDGRISLDVVHGEHRTLPARATALSNAFGFGGHNVSLVICSV